MIAKRFSCKMFHIKYNLYITTFSVVISKYTIFYCPRDKAFLNLDNVVLKLKTRTKNAIL